MQTPAKWLLIAGISLRAIAQTPAQPPAFDAASIKPAAPQTGPGMRIMLRNSKGRIEYSNVSLRDMIDTAYNVKDYQITGPDWIKDVRFDVTATMPGDTAQEQSHLMLQTLLAERFHLKLHRDKKELPAYALVVAKGGPKLKEAAPVDPETAGGGPGAGPTGGPRKGGRMMMGRGKLTAEGISISQLADHLARNLDRPVVDQTQLKGSYDITLEFTPEEGQGPRPDGARPPEGVPLADANPPLFTALQEQLGLKLNPHKLPVEILIIDSVDKVPTKN